MRFEGISFRYPHCEKPSLKSISLNLLQGKRYGLIGHNGCGKTTFLRLANGLYSPQQGNIYWYDKLLKYDRQTLKQWRQNVGLVFQNPEQQLVATTVEEDLSYGLCNLDLPPSEIALRVNLALDTFALRDLAYTPIHNLSLGQKKRVAIADVMILQPQVLLLDEPMASLDYPQTKLFKSQLEQIYQQGTTIVLASHDLDFVYNWADWLFVLDKGQLLLQGNPQDQDFITQVDGHIKQTPV